MKRFILPALIALSLATAPAPAAEDVKAYAADFLRAEAEDLRARCRTVGERSFYFWAGVSVQGELEGMDILWAFAGTERGREAVAAACRQALAGDDPYLKFAAYRFYDIYRVYRVGGDEADAYLAGAYESCGEGDVFMLADEADQALDAAADEVRAGGGEGFYGRLERDLASDDRATRLKAAKLIALMDSERSRALAVGGMQSPDADVRWWCIVNLCSWYRELAGERSHYEALEAALREDDAAVRAFAARRLAKAGDAKFVPPLLALLEDGDVSVRRAAASSAYSILKYTSEPAAGVGVSEMLLKRLKAEGDGVTRCFLAEAYGAATAEDEFGKHLTADAYWAFFTGQWREEDLEDYYY